MRRAVFVALVGVAGCNGILGIESASFTPGAAAEAGAPDAATPVGDGSPAVDTGPPCTPSDSDPHNCGTCGHDCSAGICAGGKCQPYTVLTEPDATYGAVTTDGANVYFTETRSATLKRAPIGGGGASTTMFTADPTLGMAADLAVHDGYLYFIADLTGGNGSGAIVRCPVAGCDPSGPEKIVDPLTSPTAFALDPSSGTIVVGTGGPSGSVIRCTAPPCHGAFDLLTGNVPYITQIGVNGSVIAWTNLGPLGQAKSSVTVLSSFQATSVETGSGILDMTMTADHVFYSGPNAKIESATFEGAHAPIGTANTVTNLANDGSFVYWTDSSLGFVWRVSVADGAEPTKVSSNQNGPTAVAVDGQSVTWLDNPILGGVKSSIVRVVK